MPEAFTTAHAAYDSRVRTFLTWLDASGPDGDPLTDAHDRDFAAATARPT
ncbi:hypothetical protein OG749_03560 [Streptomyces nojiriensis]